MKVLVVVAQHSEITAMQAIMALAGIKADIVSLYGTLDGKPSMKELRAKKVQFDEGFDGAPGYDYIVAAGQTAARMVLDTSAVNITKLRGRDFEYAYGTKAKAKKAQEP